MDSRTTFARLIRHPLRAHVLLEYAESVTSPRRVAAKLGARLNVVSYHTQKLLRGGAIELVRTEARRGAKEHFYRALVPNFIEDADWAELPVDLRRVLVRYVIDGVQREGADALPAGGMDGHSAHISRSYLMLDGAAQHELASLLRETFARAQEIDRASRKRVTGDATPYELVILSFERASAPE